MSLSEFDQRNHSVDTLVVIIGVRSEGPIELIGRYPRSQYSFKMTEKVEERFTYTKLSGPKNYRAWATITKVTLIDKEVWDVVNGERRKPSRAPELAEWNKANNRALKVLFTTISDKQLAYVVEEDSAERTWNRLKTLNGQSSDERLWQLLQEQFDIANQKSKSVEEKAQRIQNINAEIMSINAESILLKKYRMLLLFNSMLEVYDTMIQILQSETGMSWDQAVAKLKARELRLVVMPEEKAEGDTAYSGHQGLRCHHCGKPGHFRQDCREWFRIDKGKEYLKHQKQRRKFDPSDRESRSPLRKVVKDRGRKRKSHRVNVAKETTDEEPSAEDDEEVSFMAFERSPTKAGETSRPWIVDSGASRHMTGDKNLFVKMSPMHIVIGIANSGTMSAKGIGTVKVKVRNGKGRTMDVVIHGVLYIPKCSENLLSEGQLDEWGIETITKNGKKLIKKEGRLVATATRRGMIYFLDTVEDWAAECAFWMEVLYHTEPEEL